MKRALINRDLLLQQEPGQAITHRSQVQLLADSISAVSALCAAGYQVILLTHQPGISRGLLDLDELEAIHSKILTAVEADDGEISAIFYCPHDQSDHCHCRPPETGLLEVIEMEFDASPTEEIYFYCTEDEVALITAGKLQGVHCDQNTVSLSSAVTDHLSQT